MEASWWERLTEGETGSCSDKQGHAQFGHSVVSDSLQLHELQHPGLSVHHQLQEFTQTLVHRVSDAIQPSHPLSSLSPPALYSPYKILVSFLPW